MATWKELGQDIEEILQLESKIIAVKRLEKKEGYMDSLPCLGERAFGRVGVEEMVIALPADRLERTVKGLKTLKETGLAYPIGHMEAGMDVTPLFEQWYPVQES